MVFKSDREHPVGLSRFSVLAFLESFAQTTRVRLQYRLRLNETASCVLTFSRRLRINESRSSANVRSFCRCADQVSEQEPEKSSSKLLSFETTEARYSSTRYVIKVQLGKRRVCELFRDDFRKFRTFSRVRTGTRGRRIWMLNVWKLKRCFIHI